MNRKQFIVLLVAVAILGGAAWLHSRRQASGWSGSQNPKLGQKLLGNFQVNDVAEIRIQKGTNDLTLAKTNGIWCVEQRDNYPANFPQISRFLLTLRDLKIIQAEEVDASELPQLNLAAPGQRTHSATVLALCNAGGKPIRTLWLGKQHQHESGQPGLHTAEENWPDGRYVLTASNSTTVAVISDPLNEVTPAPEQWLDKTFIKIVQPKSISVDFQNATNSWTLARNSRTNSWELADMKPGEKLDELQAAETAKSFSSPGFEDVATDTSPEQTGLDKPTHVEINTFEGLDYSLDVGRETNDNYYLTVHTYPGQLPKEPVPAKGEKPEQIKASAEAFQARLKMFQHKMAQETAFNKWVYCVPTWSINPLLKHRSQLLVKKPAVTKTNTLTTTSPTIKQASTLEGGHNK